MELPKSAKKVLIATAVGLAVFVLALALHRTRWLEIVELKALDHRYRTYADPSKASPDIVLVAVDEASLETFGRWPWPRDRHGYLVRFLREAGAKAVIFDILFLEPDDNAEEFDQVFADEIRAAGNVFLPILFQGEPQDLAPELLAKAGVPVEVRADVEAPPLATYPGVKLPIPPLAEAARGLGFINLTPDFDGTTRRMSLVAAAQGRHFFQIAAAAARSLLGADQVTWESNVVRMGSVAVPLTSQGAMLIDWHGTLERKTYSSYSAGAVLQSFTQLQKGERPLLDPAVFKDKIVFIATTAAGTYELRVTPLSPFTPGVLIHMAALDNLLQAQFMRQAPYWVFAVATLALCLATAWSFMLIRRQVLKIGFIAALAAIYYGLAVHAFTSHGLWVELVFPEGALAVSFGVAATVEYLIEGRQRRQLRAAFDKYMSREVVEEIMRDPERIKLGGEKKELTVFFSDVAGFTTISEQLQPEELVELLNRYLSAMTDIIRRHRGNVNKYLGDGIMAIFGAPLGDPNHATLACYAALDSQAELTKLREAWKAEGLPEIVTRIGINSGLLVVGNMGSQERLEYTVMGDSVNLASRLEGANKFYDTLILLGPRTYELAQKDIEAREVDVLRVKGKKEPVTVYELLARKGELSIERKKVMELYLEGLAAYKRRDFVTAQQRFEAALALDPVDGPSKVYRERAAAYLAAPPPPDWDGVYELKSK